MRYRTGKVIIRQTGGGILSNTQDRAEITLTITLSDDDKQSVSVGADIDSQYSYEARLRVNSGRIYSSGCHGARCEFDLDESNAVLSEMLSSERMLLRLEGTQIRHIDHTSSLQESGIIGAEIGVDPIVTEVSIALTVEESVPLAEFQQIVTRLTRR